jgi:hypothetical protein
MFDVMQDGFEQIPRQDVPMKSLARGVPAMGFLRGYIPIFPAKGVLKRVS